MGKIITTSHLKRINVPIVQLVIDNYNNPIIGKKEEQINAYQEEVKQFEYVDIPIVYKKPIVFTKSEQEYLVLTNVQEVEIRKRLGCEDMDVIEIDDNFFTPDDAFRFALHRSTFQDLSNESRFHAFNKVYERLEKDRQWAMAIKTNDGKTISKVSKLTGRSVGSIHQCITIGKKDLNLLKDVDNKKLSLQSAYKRVKDADPKLKTPKGKKRTFGSSYDGYADQLEKHTGNAKMPLNEIKLCITENDFCTSLILNDVELKGYRSITNNLNDGITEIKFRSDDEPLIITIEAPYMQEYFKEKGFITESEPRQKLDVSSLLPSKISASTFNYKLMVQDAIKGVITLGVNKNKAEDAVNKALHTNPKINDLSLLIKKSVQMMHAI